MVVGGTVLWAQTGSARRATGVHWAGVDDDGRWVDLAAVEFLHTLTERCVELLDADTAGLLLADERGALRLAAASTSQAQILELFQLQQQQEELQQEELQQEEEGPCLDCYHSGQVVTLTDVRRSRRCAATPATTTGA